MFKIFLLEGDTKTERLNLLISYIMRVLQHKACIIIITKTEQEVLGLKELPCIVKDDEVITKDIPQMVCKIAEVDSLLLKTPEIWNYAKTFYFQEEQPNLLEVLNERLSSLVFIFNPHITLADIFAAVPAIRALQIISKGKIMQYVHVYRWAIHLLSLPFIGDILNGKTGGLAPLLSLADDDVLSSMDKKDKRDELRAEKKKKKEKGKEKAKQEAIEPFAQLDLRVGRVIKVEVHPNSSKLYIEEVDIGTEIRKVVSGIKEFITIEELLNHNVVVFCNLKPKSIVGYMSHGIILCAFNKDQSKVEILEPTQNSKPGDMVIVEGIERQLINEVNLSKHNNPWKKVETRLTTNEELTVTLDGEPLRTTDGPIKVKSLKAAQIS
jgi:methionine--tRNA ligase beta chain